MTSLGAMPETKTDMSRRTERIANELQAEVARLLREEVTDPRIGLLTITRLDVAPDLSHAIVFYSPLHELDEDELMALDDGLHSAAPFLRKRAARELPFKRMPAFDFRYDAAFSLGSHTLSVLQEIQSEAAPRPDAEPEEGE